MTEDLRAYRVHSQTFTGKVTISPYGLVRFATLEVEHLLGWHERKFLDYCWRKGWRVVKLQEREKQS